MISKRGSWRDWCQLIRLPNVFTVVADTTAAFLLASATFEIVPYVTVVIAVCSLYWAGMIFNDVWDIEIDRIERPSRPLPAERIELSSAKRAGWFLMALGIGLAFAAGYVPQSTPVPGLIAMVLAACILLYDGPAKSTPLATLFMGACRFFSFLLGASAASVEPSLPYVQPFIIAIGLGLGVYIVGVTLMAQGEARGGNRGRLVFGLFVITMGLSLVAGGPSFTPEARQFRIDPMQGFPLLIGMLGITVIYRAGKAIIDPQPKVIQASIRHAILTLIPLSAAIVLLSSSYVVALAVFFLVVPALYLGKFLRIT